MKKKLLFLLLLSGLSCRDEAPKKPNVLIEKSKMVAIMYDLLVLDAIKYTHPAILDSNPITSKEFIYKKYKIDSLQLAQNNIYYATDYKSYKILLDEVAKRLETHKLKVTALLKKKEKKHKIAAQKKN